MRIQNQTHDPHAISFMRAGKRVSMLLMRGQTVGDVDTIVGELPKGVVKLGAPATPAPATPVTKD